MIMQTKRRQRLTLRVEQSVRSYLKARAKQSKQSMSAVLNGAMTAYIAATATVERKKARRRRQ